MAINKNAYIRYQVLDRCFRNPGRKYYWQDLLRVCNEALAEYNGPETGIRRRQLFEDIRFMESEQGWAIPLKRHQDGKRVYYRYEDLGFSINNRPLNETEVQQLKAAVMVLVRMKGLPQFEWVLELIPRLEQSLSMAESGPDVIAFGSNEYLRGLSHLGGLFRAILNKQVLYIDYQPFRHEQASRITIHPYFLKQYNNRWFLLGYNPDEAYITNLALDRMEAVAEAPLAYAENSMVDFDEYFEDIIGVTRLEEGVLEKVVLLVKPELAKYVLTKPLHGSQRKLGEDGDGLRLQLSVIPNFELEQVILSYGEGMVVLAPESLRQRIRERFEAALGNYGIKDKSCFNMQHENDL